MPPRKKGKGTKPTPKKEEAEEKQLADLLAEHHGNISCVARALNLGRKTVYDRISKSERLKEALADAREIQIDEAEDSLGQAVREKQGWAVCFYLKTQGRRRGYVEKDDQGISLTTLARITEELGAAVIAAAKDIDLDESTSTKLFDAIQSRWDAIKFEPHSKRA